MKSSTVPPIRTREYLEGGGGGGMGVGAGVGARV